MSPQNGQKVTLGDNAPITQESTGAVASDSLAAESQAFQSGNSATPRTIPHSDLLSASKPYAGSRADGGDSTTRSGTGSGAHVVDEAPSYVSNFQVRDAAGPHGRNVTEDQDMTRDSAKNASFTEFGTKGDPARLAEEKIVKSNAGGGGGAAAGVGEETPFSALSSSEQA